MRSLKSPRTIVPSPNLSVEDFSVEDFSVDCFSLPSSKTQVVLIQSFTGIGQIHPNRQGKHQRSYLYHLSKIRHAWTLPWISPELGRLTSLTGHSPRLAFSSSLQMIAIVRSSVMDVALSLLVQIFQATGVRRCFSLIRGITVSHMPKLCHVEFASFPILSYIFGRRFYRMQWNYLKVFDNF